LRPIFDTDVESGRGTALMVLAGSDPWTILVTWLNRGPFVPCKAISLVFDKDSMHVTKIGTWIGLEAHELLLSF